MAVLKWLMLVVASASMTTAQNPNNAITCATPIRNLYASHPQCAQSCLGCDASNETFEHNCDINSACCQGTIALAMIPLVYACVKTACPAADSQASWEEFLRNCAQRGLTVAEGDTPGGYTYVTFETKSPPTKTDHVETPNQTTSTATGVAPGVTQTASSGNSESGTGLTTAEIIGIALGSVSALAAVMGARWGRMRWARRGSVDKEGDDSSELGSKSSTSNLGKERGGSK